MPGKNIKPRSKAEREAEERKARAARKHLVKVAYVAQSTRAAIRAFQQALPSQRMDWDPPRDFDQLTAQCDALVKELAEFSAWARAIWPSDRELFAGDPDVHLRNSDANNNDQTGPTTHEHEGKQREPDA